MHRETWMCQIFYHIKWKKIFCFINNIKIIHTLFKRGYIKERIFLVKQIVVALGLADSFHCKDWNTFVSKKKKSILCTICLAISFYLNFVTLILLAVVEERLNIFVWYPFKFKLKEIFFHLILPVTSKVSCIRKKRSQIICLQGNN